MTDPNNITEPLLEETWKPIKGYEGIYEVSNLGQIRTWRRTFANSKQSLPHKIKLQKSKSGKCIWAHLYKKGRSIGEYFNIGKNLKIYFPEL